MYRRFVIGLISGTFLMYSVAGFGQTPAAQDKTRQTEATKNAQNAKPVTGTVKKIDKKKKKAAHVTPAGKQAQAAHSPSK